MQSKKYKISFCIVCMNRLHHLSQTLPINIFDNEDYEDLEFVLLDYNSNDGLEGFVKENFSKDIENGKLIYYKTNIPKYFNRSHSRNLAFRLASGDLICNIDADNYTGKNFAAYVNDKFQKSDNIFLTPLGLSGTNSKKDVLGRICIKRVDFYRIKGYDERMINYGFEDNDFANRLEISGLSRVKIAEHGDYLRAIFHEEKERLSNELVLANLKDLFLNYLSPSSTEFLFLFRDNKFKRGTLIDNMTFQYAEPINELKRSQLKYTYSIFQDSWKDGIWSGNESELILKEDNHLTEKLVFDEARNCFTTGSDNTNSNFYKLSDPSLIQDAVMFFSQTTNRIIMDKNKLEQQVIVNHGNFGMGIVYKNFEQKPIIIN